MDENIKSKILEANLQNIARKVASGKTLTSSERALIEIQNGAVDETKTYAESVVELSEILGVSRRTIGNWRKMKGSPKATANGKHNIAKWRKFISKNGLKETDTPEDEALKSRKLLAEVRQAELKLKTMEGMYVSIEKVREVWTIHIGQVRSILESRFLNELPPILTTLTAIQIREKMQEVLDESYKALSIAGGSIQEPVDVD